MKFTSRPGDTPQESGRRFETFWAKLFGVKAVKGSGSLWYAKMDVGDGAILWSCKHTEAESFRITRELMKEAERAINGNGGVGGSTLPGIATSLEGEVFVTLRAEDFLRMVAAEVKYVRPSRADQKRINAKTPLLLRDEADE